MELLMKFDEVKKKLINGFNYDTIKKSELENEIAKSMGIYRPKIYKWKHEIEMNVRTLKQNLEKLTKKVDQLEFISIITKKDNNKVNIDNSYFVYSLSKAMQFCEEEITRKYSDKGQLANLLKGDRLVGQLICDFNSLIIEIDLMKIGEYAVATITAEEVEKICKKLEHIKEFQQSNDIYKMANSAKQQIFDMIKENNALMDGETGNLIEPIEWVVSDELVNRIKQILVKMIIKIKYALYKKDFYRKIRFLVQSAHVNMDEIKAISEISKQKFRDFRAYLTINGDASKFEILLKLAEKPKEIELVTWEQIAKNISIGADDMVTEPLTDHTKEIQEIFEIPEEDIAIAKQKFRDISTSFSNLTTNEDKKLEKKYKLVREISDEKERSFEASITSTVHKDEIRNAFEITENESPIQQKEDENDED